MRPQLSEKENLLRAIRHQDPHHVPVRHLDGRIPGMVKIYYHGCRALREGVDRWGVTWAGGVPAGEHEWEPEIMGYPVAHPLHDLPALVDYPFPSPEEAGIMDGLLNGIDRNQVLVLGELPFLILERARELMGMEALFVALVTHPDLVRQLLRRIADYQIGIVRRYAALGVDAIRGADDYGTQTALQIAPHMWRALVKPELARVFQAAKEAGLVIFLHSCGHIMEIVPDLLEIGLDVLDPVQSHANDHSQLKYLYGDRLTFMGGVDTQYVLTQGTPDEVAQEVRARIACLGGGGGYILGPENLIPVPEANSHAYLAAGKRYGQYPLKP